VYGLEPGLDLSFWSGASLDQVAIGLHQVQLIFDQQISLSVEGDYRVGDASEMVTFSDATSGASHIVRLLGLNVLRAIDAGQGVLRVEFSGGLFFEAVDSSDLFESYNFHNGSDLYIV
jgi:hypothetical protein